MYFTMFIHLTLLALHPGIRLDLTSDIAGIFAKFAESLSREIISKTEEEMEKWRIIFFLISMANVMCRLNFPSSFTIPNSREVLQLILFCSKYYKLYLTS